MMLPNFPIPLFDLSWSSNVFRGYFMDREGTVYSTKSGSPVRLKGSCTPSGRYFTLNKRSFRQDNLQLMARNHPKFLAETTHLKSNVLPAAPKNVAPSMQWRTKEAREAIRQKGFLLATLSPAGKLVFGTEPMFHLLEQSARDEAERVASTTGAEIVMLKIVGKVKVQKAVWE